MAPPYAWLTLSEKNHSLVRRLASPDEGSSFRPSLRPVPATERVCPHGSGAFLEQTEVAVNSKSELWRTALLICFTSSFIVTFQIHLTYLKCISPCFHTIHWHTPHQRFSYFFLVGNNYLLANASLTIAILVLISPSCFIHMFCKHPKYVI